MDGGDALTARLHFLPEASRNTRERIAHEVGEDLCGVLREVSRSLGFDGVQFVHRVTGYSCDGAGCSAETKDRDADGWTRREDGADWCAKCSPVK